MLYFYFSCFFLVYSFCYTVNYYQLVRHEILLCNEALIKQISLKLPSIFNTKGIYSFFLAQFAIDL